MTKALFFNNPMYGHVLPTLAVVRELVARGEQVVYYLTDEFAQPIREAGATFCRYESTLKNNRPEGRFSRFLASECQYVIPQVIESIRRARPDYIVYEENCLWGRIVAQAAGVPLVSCRANLAVNKHFSHLSDLLGTGQNQGFSGVPFQLLIDTFNDLAPLVDFCAGYQLPCPRQDVENIFFHAEDLNIVFVSRLLQPAGETFDERFVFVGPAIASQEVCSAPPEEPFLTPGDLPTLYISLGTIYNRQPDFYQHCFQAFGAQSWRVIMSVGRQVDQTEFGTVPENFSLATSVPQLEVLQHTALFVTHGGLNSIMEALYYGVPMVIIPQMPEQVVTAHRLADLGLAVVLDKQAVTADALRDAVQQLSQDRALRTRMQRVQKEVQASGGATRAAEAILHFVEERSVSKAR